LTPEDYLTIKSGELIAKTEELNEANESLHLLNNEFKIKIQELKKSKKALLNTDNSLLIANNKLTETNEKFAKLNKELAVVNKELVRVNEQIKQHHIKQKEFISIASHELKTPTQSILGYIELLQLDPQINHEYTEPIMRNAKRLQRIIFDILDMSRIDNNTLVLNKEQFNLTEAMSNIVQDLQNQIIHDNKSVNIIYDGIDMKKDDKGKGKDEKDIVIEGDRERITQVISNILDNAMRSTQEGIIRIDVERKNIINNENDNISNCSEEIIINISDSGKGIDAQTFPNLFSKFFSTSGTGGTGLGLFICKAIIEAHGGNIWAINNKNGKGSTFSFSLPLVDITNIKTNEN
jgi:two-component system sensor histidine kinase VicK